MDAVFTLLRIQGGCYSGMVLPVRFLPVLLLDLAISGYVQAHLSVETINDEGLRGVTATVDVREGDSIALLPTDLIIEMGSERHSSAVRPICRHRCLRICCNARSPGDSSVACSFQFLHAIPEAQHVADLQQCVSAQPVTKVTCS